MLFCSKVMDRTAIKQLISRSIAHFGITYTTHILDQLKNGIFSNFICFFPFSFKNYLSKFKILFLLRFKRFNFKNSSLRAMRLEDLCISPTSSKTLKGPPHGIQVEGDKFNKHGHLLLRCTIKPKLGLYPKIHLRTYYPLLKKE